MKKILLFLAMLFVNCTQPTINVQTVNQPVISGITSGYFTKAQTFSVSNGYGGTVQYSLDAGTTWLTYSGTVTLSPTKLYKVIARQYDTSGDVSGDTPEIDVYIDSTPPTVLTTSTLISGAYVNAQTIWVQPLPNQTIQYTLNGGSSWITLPSGTELITLSTNGTYNFIVRTLSGNGQINTSTTPVNITIAIGVKPTISGITTGNYSTTQTFNVSLSSGLSTQYSTDGGTTWVTTTTGGPIGLGNGTYLVEARYQDVANQYSSLSTTYTLIIGNAGVLLINPTITTGDNFLIPQTFSLSGATSKQTVSVSENNGVTWNTLSNKTTYTTQNYGNLVLIFQTNDGTTDWKSSTQSFTINQLSSSLFDPALSLNSSTIASQTSILFQNGGVWQEVVNTPNLAWDLVFASGNAQGIRFNLANTSFHTTYDSLGFVIQVTQDGNTWENILSITNRGNYVDSVSFPTDISSSSNAFYNYRVYDSKHSQYWYGFSTPVTIAPIGLISSASLTGNATIGSTLTVAYVSPISLNNISYVWTPLPDSSVSSYVVLNSDSGNIFSCTIYATGPYDLSASITCPQTISIP